MASSKWEILEARELDETWEMNIHINPIDEDTKETMKRHKAIFENHADDFVDFIKHTESKLKFNGLNDFRCSQTRNNAPDLPREVEGFRQSLRTWGDSLKSGVTYAW
jgi:hypothetical protein